MLKNKEETKAQPILYANILKILASFAVVMIHVAAIEWYKTEGNTYAWKVMNFYDSICRWSVPVFVMVTGMLLLPKEITITKVFTKYIKKIVTLLIFWTVCFAFLTTKIQGTSIWHNLVYGNYHLWYLYMLIGLYLITPIIKPLVEPKNNKILKYFLILWFLFEVCLGTFFKIQKENPMKVLLDNMHMSLILGYVGYYLLGYYLNTNSLDKIKRRILYGLGGIATIIIILGTQYAKINCQEIVSIFYDFLSLPVAICAMSVFVGVKQICEKKQVSRKGQNRIQKWTKLTLGVYLIHPMFVQLMKPLNISVLEGKVEITILLTTIIIYLLSIATTYLLSKIPKIGKYIV